MTRFLLPLGNAGVFVGLLLIIGSASLYWLVLEDRQSASARSAAVLGELSGTLMMLSLLTQFAAQLLEFNLPPDPLVPDARTLLALPWGRVWSVQFVLALIATRAYGRAKRGGGAIWRVLAFLVVVLAFTPAFAGHAAAEAARPIALSADGVHVLAAGMWLGTLGALAFTAGRNLPPGGTLLLGRVRRFSRWALVAAPVVALSGVVSAWLRLGQLPELWGSSYGRVLMLKLLLFACVGAVGFFNWRRATPKLVESGDSAAIRASIRWELVLALAVILVTAFLVTTPPPSEG